MGLGKIKTLVAAGLCAISGFAVALPSASVNLYGFIQNGLITNNAASGANLVSVVYDLGAAAPGIATWEVNGGGTLGGSTSQTNFLPQGDWFQTATWAGLNVAPGAAFSFNSLDIDYIVSLNPFHVTGSFLDDLGASLANASITLTWSDNSSATCALAQQAWSTNQNFSCGSSPANHVPEPSSLALLALSAVVLVRQRRRA